MMKKLEDVVEENNSDEYTLTGLVSLVRQWSYRNNIIHGSTSKDQLCKLTEEIGELATGINKKIPEKVKDGIGNSLVVLINIAEQNQLNIKDCLDHAYKEIRHRKGKMVDGIFIKNHDKDISRYSENNISSSAKMKSIQAEKDLPECLSPKYLPVDESRN